ncbi:MAG: hypothetical protein M1812_006249 [Candelaria pacifica]|nr:MAG: hypothetical protein M1812_006249 [Candelaria pacifica]
MDEDPSISDQENEIAFSMGFKSFGTAKTPHASKKRKFNPEKDVRVDEDTGIVVAGSGGNSIPLGKGGIRGSKNGETRDGRFDGNEGVEESFMEVDGDRDTGGLGDGDEISLLERGLRRGGGEGEEVNEGDGREVKKEEIARFPARGGGDHEDGEFLSQSPNIASQHPSTLNISSTIQHLNPLPQIPSSSSSSLLPPKPTFATSTSSSKSRSSQFTPQNQQLLQSSTSQKPHLSREELQQLRCGVRDKNGEITYYDSSFVENPWLKLEEREEGRD